MKTLPSNWTEQQIAYFAGLISARCPFGHLKKIIEHLNIIVPPAHERWFQSFIAVLEPRISADQWQGCVETCTRLFA